MDIPEEDLFGRSSFAKNILHLIFYLLSPALEEQVSADGDWRKEVWGGKKGAWLSYYEEMTAPAQAASDHAAFWGDINF
jgi:hypothetical protein